MPISFSGYLKHIRQDMELTQQQLIEILIERSTKFTKLDLTTYSRWERGITTPKLSKQILIARLLGYDPASLVDPNSKISLKKHIIFEQAKQSRFNPYGQNFSSLTSSMHKKLAQSSETYEQLNTFHRQHMGLDLNVESLDGEKILISSFCDSIGKMEGHLLYGYVPITLENRLLKPNNLAECKFVDLTESTSAPLDMYVISGYSNLQEPKMLTLLFILDALRKNPNIKNVYINCHNQAFYNVYEENFGAKITFKGNTVLFGGVKVFGRHYQFVQMKASSEDILSSTVVADLVPFTDSHICNLTNGR
ncbi:helix-turn-helix domain-containing protein [Vibrio lentus]|uniref:helix-turn-helix domain-containing protein n=1 Tax=Vibrio lentus TaxID=136468 RepID=UPI000C8234E1|nr:helix-turn-helix transcriptional regulator [Vibrio lentus]PMI92254.1 hypothetical protein BCU33_09655 [Vibrio lentus]PMJ06114.1 hypothetical protein BCU31_03375 [Vibrio lentus]TKG19622.1 helix-turn-helix transcriptional regulator [Vibrio lentus]